MHFWMEAFQDLCSFYLNITFFSPNGISLAHQTFRGVVDISGITLKFYCFHCSSIIPPIVFFLFVDYHWFLFILFEILKINTWWGVLVRLKQYIYSVYIAMKLSSLEVAGFWLTGVTASLITHRQIAAYYTHRKYPHNFLPSLLRTVLRVLVYSQNILQVSTEVGGCLQCG